MGAVYRKCLRSNGQVRFRIVKKRQTRCVKDSIKDLQSGYRVEGLSQKTIYVPNGNILFLFVTVFPESFFALVRGNFMSFSFLSARHKLWFLKINKDLVYFAGKGSIFCQLFTLLQRFYGFFFVSYSTISLA